MEQHQSDESAMTQQQQQQEAPRTEDPKFRVGDLAIFRVSGEESVELRGGVLRGQGDTEGTLSVACEQKVFNVPLMALVSTIDPVGLNGKLEASLVHEIGAATEVLKRADTAVRSAQTDNVGFAFSFRKEDGPDLQVGPELARATSLAMSTQAKLNVINAVIKLLNTL